MKISKAAIILTSGFAIGAVTGMLIAPDEGAKTRKMLLKKGKRFKRDISHKAEEFREKASDLRENIEGAAHDLKRRFS